VRDYNEAIDFSTRILDFRLLEDTDLGGGKRWVRVAATNGAALLLVKAVGDEQLTAVGNQAGGRVGFFLHTDDFHRDYHCYRSRGVVFEGEPRRASYGTVAVFADLAGNRWDLIEMDAGVDGALE